MTGSGTKTTVSKDLNKISRASSRIIKLMEDGDRNIFVLRDTVIGEGSKAVLAVVCGDHAEDFFNQVKKTKAFRARKKK